MYTKRDHQTDPDPVRARAIRQLHRKRGVQAHVLAYLLGNVIQVLCWWVWTPDIMFWPAYSILGWGVGLAFHIWAVYSSAGLDEERVRREMARIQNEPQG